MSGGGTNTERISEAFERIWFADHGYTVLEDICAKRLFDLLPTAAVVGTEEASCSHENVLLLLSYNERRDEEIVSVEVGTSWPGAMWDTHVANCLEVSEKLPSGETNKCLRKVSLMIPAPMDKSGYDRYSNGYNMSGKIKYKASMHKQHIYHL